MLVLRNTSLSWCRLAGRQGRFSFSMGRHGTARVSTAPTGHAITAGRVHSAGWPGKYGLLRTDDTRDSRATWSVARQVLALPERAPRTGGLCRRTIDHRAVVAACTIATDCCWRSCGRNSANSPKTPQRLRSGVFRGDPIDLHIRVRGSEVLTGVATRKVLTRRPMRRSRSVEPYWARIRHPVPSGENLVHHI